MTPRSLKFAAAALLGTAVAVAAVAAGQTGLPPRITGGPEATASAPATTQPATGPAATEKGPWADSQVGTSVTLTVAGNRTRTLEVLGVDANSVTIRSAIDVENVKPTTSQVPRMYTPEVMIAIMESYGKKSGQEKLKIGQKDCPCDVYERVVYLAGRKVVNRTWICKEVPGWEVRVDNDASGEVKTILQVVKYNN
jgi:hypothetical protein